MILEMGKILRGETNRIDFEYFLTPMPLDRITFEGDAHVVGYVTDNAGYMRLIATASLAYSAECDRCLEPVKDEYVLQFERTVADEGTLSEEQLEDNIDEYVVIQDAKLDIDEQLTEALLLEFPRKILCSEDCAGLCPKCGKILKYGACSCPTKEIDPRLAVLAQLLEKDEE